MKDGSEFPIMKEAKYLGIMVSKDMTTKNNKQEKMKQLEGKIVKLANFTKH